MAYTKLGWVNDRAPALNQTNLNHMDQGIFDAHQEMAEYEGIFTGELNDLSDDLSDLKSVSNYIRNDYYSYENAEFVAGFYIKTNLAVGATVDVTPLAASSYMYVKIACEKMQKFYLTSSGGSTARGWCFIDSSNKVVSVSNADLNFSNELLVAPTDGYLICNNKTSYPNPVLSVEVPFVDNDILEDVPPEKTTFFDATSHNMINDANVTSLYYYSPGSAKIVTSSGGTSYGLTGLIEVKEGETYTYSGTATTSNGNSYGGYFAEDAVIANNQAAISGIEFFDPVTGSGKCFTVPIGQNIKYVALDLKKNTSTQEIEGTYQLEKGEMATPIVPYELVYKIDPQYLPDVSAETVASIDTLPRPSYVSEYSKIANFMEHMMAKDKDLMMVGTGTSLTARSSEHCTLRADATSRPPLLHSNNFASDIWDRVKWDGQQYRRFDYTGFFTETGSFSSSANDSNWDDANYRYGITRFASGSASVGFIVPEEAWQFNFIYRTDTSGSESVSVTISEGNGKMEVWNGSAWVEANGYTFSMKETAIVLSNIEVCDPNTIHNSKVSQSSYQVGGNTTYQKRLKMRCKSSLIDSRDATKAVTISSTSGRLLYWGVEWSPREFMLTYVNAARGSHNMTYNSALSLAHYQDNEIWSFKPDLIFTENPIHNSGAAGADLAPYRTTYWGYSTYDFFFNTDNPTSLASRAAHYGITDLEWIIFTSSLSWNFGGIDDNGELKLYEDKDGNVLSALDAQTLCHAWTLENEPTVISINACKFWCDAGRKLFGNLKAATVGSGKGGSTFTNEGSHWNDTGSAVIDRCVGGVFDFYN